MVSSSGCQLNWSEGEDWPAKPPRKWPVQTDIITTIPSPTTCHGRDDNHDIDIWHSIIATKICTWEARKAGRRPLRSCSISSMLARLRNFQIEYYRDQVKRASICLCCCLWPNHWHWLWHNQSQSRAATATASNRALQRCTLLVQFSVYCLTWYENKGIMTTLFFRISSKVTCTCSVTKTQSL